MIGLNGKGQSVTALPDSVLSQCCLEVTLLNGNVTTVDWVFIQYVTRDGTGTKLFVEYAPNFGGIQWETQIRIQDDFDDVLERSKFIVIPFTVGSTDYGINRNWIANIEENTTTGGTWIYGRFGTPTKRKFSAVEDYETMKNLLLACRPRAIVVAENGLYTEGDTVRMGGFLIEPTTITAEGYNWQMKDTLSSAEFGLDYLTPETGDTTVYWGRRSGSVRQMVQMGNRYWYNTMKDTVGGLFSDLTMTWNSGDPFLKYLVFNPLSPTSGTAWVQVQRDNSFLLVSNETINPYYTAGWTVTSNSAQIGVNESGSGDPGNGVVMGAFGDGTSNEYLFMVTKAVDNNTATNGQYLQLVDNTNGKVEFATIDLSAYLPIADTAAMLDPYIQGAGTINRVPIFTGSRVIGNSNIQDNGTAVSILSSKPFHLGQWTTAGRPSGTTGYEGYNTTGNGKEWYQGSRWAYALESTFARGTSTYVPFFDANGQLTQQSTFNYTPATSLLTITDGNGQYNPTITRYQQVINRRATTGGANAGLYVNSIQSISGLSGFVSGVRVDIGASSGGTSAIPMLAYSANFNIGNSSPSYWAGFSNQGGIVNVGTLSNPVRTFSSAAGWNIAAGSSMSSHSGLYTSLSVIGSGPLADAYGVQIAPQTGNITNNWGLYQSGALERNVFRGKTTFGSTTAPVYDLDGSGSTNAFGLPRGTVANQPAIVASTTPLRFFTDTAAIGYGDGGVYNFIATRAYARLVASNATWLKPQLESVGDVKISSTNSLTFKQGTTRWTTSSEALGTSITPGNVTLRKTSAGNFGGFFAFADTIDRDNAFFFQQDDRGTIQNTGTGRQLTLVTENTSLPGTYRWAFGARVDTSTTSLATLRVMLGDRYASALAPITVSINAGLQPSESVNNAAITMTVSGDAGKKAFTVNNAITTRMNGKVYFASDSTFLFDPATDVLQLSQYGSGIKEAADLSKTQSNYIAGFATEGTVLDLKIGTGLAISGGELTATASAPTQILAESYNRITSTSSPQTFSSTISDNIVDQGSTQASFTFDFPASPVDGQVLTVTWNNAISVVTLNGNGNTIVGTAVTTAVAGSQRKFKYCGTCSTAVWIKIY